MSSINLTIIYNCDRNTCLLRPTLSLTRNTLQTSVLNFIIICTIELWLRIWHFTIIPVVLLLHNIRTPATVTLTDVTAMLWHLAARNEVHSIKLEHLPSSTQLALPLGLVEVDAVVRDYNRVFGYLGALLLCGQFVALVAEVAHLVRVELRAVVRADQLRVAPAIGVDHLVFLALCAPAPLVGVPAVDVLVPLDGHAHVVLVQVVAVDAVQALVLLRAGPPLHVAALLGFGAPLAVAVRP